MIEIGGLGNCLTDSEEKSAGWSLIEKLSAAENAKKQDRKLSDARRDTWAHTSPCATTAPSLRMVLREEGDRIRIRKSNSKHLSAKPCSQPKKTAPICVVVHSLHWMIHH